MISFYHMEIEYTLMPTHMRHPFSVEELRDLQLGGPFSFTKGCRILKVAAQAWFDAHSFGSMLFDLETDPKQERPMRDPENVSRMTRLMIQLMKESDAPVEQFERLGFLEKCDA